MPQTNITAQATQNDVLAQTSNGVVRPADGAGKQSVDQNQEGVFVPHAQIEPTGHTPAYWRLFTSAAVMRYGFEFFRDTSRDHVKPSGTQKKVLNTTDEIVSNLTNSQAYQRGMKQLENYAVEFTPKEWGTIQGQKVLSSEVAQSIEEDVYKAVRQHEYAHYYDRGLGIGSGVLTLAHSYGTAQNIKKLYAETVALEFDKRPEDVLYSDILKSKNEIVQNTLDNAVSQNAVRLASDAVFMGRSLSALEGIAPVFGRARSMNFAYLGLALKGALLTKDISQKHSTVFEALTGLIDKKINSVHGISDAINAGDVIDIYQKYATFAKPENMFLDVTVRQHSDMDMDWPKSERMFSRIADLMNQTYKYKKSSLSDEERIKQSTNVEVDFGLPKYVHLLGQGLIDPTKPEQTMTIVEIAAHHDMKAVREAVTMFNELHAAPKEVAARYHVTIDPKEKLVNQRPHSIVKVGDIELSLLQAPQERQLH